MEKEDEERLDSYVTALAATIRYAGTEPIVLAQLEEFFSPKPAQLAASDSDGNELQERADRVVEQLGGPPRLLITSVDGPKPCYDLYPAAAMYEVVKMYHRTRRSVCRAQMFLVGSHLLREKPEMYELPMEDSVRTEFLEAVGSAFWEHAETAYIRIASYWDRVGQLLDFAFFSIRQFERDGFTAVVDRIHSNFTPVDTALSKLPAWISLRAFQTSEKEDGLKWLLRRRNFLVHSLYLRPLNEPGGLSEPGIQSLFDSEFNHIEVALRNKLAPGTPAQEIERLNCQLRKAAEFFPAVLDLCEHATTSR